MRARVTTTARRGASLLFGVSIGAAPVLAAVSSSGPSLFAKLPKGASKAAITSVVQAAETVPVAKKPAGELSGDVRVVSPDAYADFLTEPVVKPPICR